jgi:ribosome maturation factor RimP
MRQTALERKIFDIIEPVANDMGLRLVYVSYGSTGGAGVLQVVAEDKQTRRLNVGQCAELSRAASMVMDVEDPIESAYRLEVSSPGIDRLLVSEEDFKNYIGFEAKLEADMPLDTGQKRFRGILKGIESGDITIETDQGVAVIPFGMLKKAKLVLTDELIKATADQ